MKRRAWMLAAGLAIAATALAATAATAAEGNAPEVSPRVTTVATGGEWTSPKGSGVLRVVIADTGFSHVHSRLWIEWLTVGERGAPRRVARVLVKELSGGMNVLEAGNRRETFQGGRIRLRATHTYSQDSSDITIETGKPGEYKLL
ncbi:hypothetical protein [Variovorax sp. PAMC26660]|uniref:hypothetical protein n=1 Tax=Variovorax sp. PAMC26660 TaxID=2762322 RepID=UPI00164DF51A|nr:hypothetical protein [Variovorax sp. PAMC26660]QNK65232.1 hypothetical protein H7F35_18565 [Variovorax sp. PAMC26660]